MPTTLISTLPQNRSTWINLIAFLVIGILLIVFPRTAPVLLVFFGIISIWSNISERVGRRTWVGAGSVSLILLVIFGYLLINSSWSLDISAAYSRAFLFALFGGAALISINAIDRERIDKIEPRAWGFLIGVSIGLIYLFLEVITDRALKTSLFNMVPSLRPSLKHITVEQGLVTHIKPADLNRSLGALVFILWPCLLIILEKVRSHAKWGLIAGMLALSVLAIYGSVHASSKLALPVGMAVFAIAWYAPRLAYWGMMGAWCASVIFIVPLALGVYQSGFHQKSWIDPSAGQARIIIWGVTAKETLKTPILGVGLRSTRHVSAKLGKDQKKLEGYAYKKVTGRHGHNIFVQTWYELGAVGAGLLLVLGISIINLISRLARDHQPFAYATFANMVTVAAFSWGIWQIWYMALLGIAPFIMAMAVRYSRLKAVV